LKLQVLMFYQDDTKKMYCS